MQEEVREKKKGITLLQLITVILIFSIVLNLFFICNRYKYESVIGKSFALTQPYKKVLIDSNKEGEGIIQYNELKIIINEEIAKENAQDKVGIYIQDMKTGSWLGINERVGFAPASLLKVPIMMAVLKEVDRGELKLEDTFEVKEEDVDFDYGNLYENKIGTQVKVIDLLEDMIASSDNTAKNVFRRKLSISEIDTVFKHVGIPDPYLAQEGNQTVSTRDYIRFFKALYYSTFLSPELSEKALDLTTDTQEENLISSGVPTEIQVAHKFGVYDQEILHDCGIVYHRENPYFICIMTKEIGLERSAELIRKISLDTYNFVDEKSK